MSFLRALLATVMLAIPATAIAQSTLLQSGPIATGRVPMYTTSGTQQPTVIDSGPAGGGGIGVGLSELNITARGAGAAPYASKGSGPYGTISCLYDGPKTSAAGYHYLCMSPNAQGGGLFAYGAGGAAAQLPFKFIVNGSTYEFPFTTSGALGPGTTTVGKVACWGNTTGTLLGECSDLPLMPSQFGAVCNGVTDDTAAIQNMITSAISNGRAIYFPSKSGKCRVTSALNITARGITIKGEGCSYQTDTSKGSWLYFDHLGKGIVLSGTQFNGTWIDGICTARNQPAAGPGWAPVDADFDIHASGASDLRLSNLFMLNATRGIFTDSRLFLSNWSGQFFKVGFQANNSQDVVRISGAHLWPFWNNGSDVATYMRANLKAFELGRMDNPHFTDVFSIWAKYCLYFEDLGQGHVNKGVFENIDCDENGTNGISYAASASNTNNYFSNLLIQNFSPSTTPAIDVQAAAGSHLYLENTRLVNAGLNVAGGSNRVLIGNIWIDSYGQGVSTAAITSGATNAVLLSGALNASNGGGGPRWAGSNATIRMNSDLIESTPTAGSCGTSPSLAPGSTDSSGTITIGTGSPATCAINFGTAWFYGPRCDVQATVGGTASVTVVTTSTTLTISANPTSSVAYTYDCKGVQ